MPNSIVKLADIFQEYKIYPKNKFTINTPVKHFLKKFPASYYSHDLNEFLKYQNYTIHRRGADLPWWGEKYFSSENGIRVMIISQDSLAKDANSIVFYANMFPYSDEDFKSWEDKFRQNRSFYNSWKKLKILLASWKIDFNFVYMTDARKVYKQSDKKNFDNKLCKELLVNEIDLCKPDLIICLGRHGLNLLTSNYKKYKLNDIVNSQTDNPIIINNMLCYVSYFPTGNGATNFNKYESMITRGIQKYLKTIAG